MLHALSLFLAVVSYDTVATDSATRDSLRTVKANAITVVADQAPRTSDVRTEPAIRTIDQLMELASASMTRRAALASEPTIRGLHAGQVALSIDGMKVHAACVDHMDPPTAYMELSSLDKLDVQRGAEDMRYGANLGGALTFSVRKPEFDADPSAKAVISGESNGMNRSTMLDLAASVDDAAIRLAYTYRSANDYRAGNNVRVAGSHFEKHNLTAGAAWRLAPSHSIYADIITDVASFIGFPALLMDTRRAVGLIGSLTWKGAWGNSLKTSVKAYANSVDHTMDDYSRPLSQITTRRFMNNMYMPMTGRSTTIGLLAEASKSMFGGAVSVVVDASWLHARADMTMNPLDVSVTPMHLINVGDANIGIVGMMGKYDVVIDDRWSFTAQIRADVSPRSLQDEVAQSVLQAYTPTAQFQRMMVGLSSAATCSYVCSDEISTRLTISTGQRMPSHLEQYGFYLYDPQSMYTTIGNPNLIAERSVNLEASATFRSDDAVLIASAFVQHISNYIAPNPQTQFQSGTMPPERVYGNIGGAVLQGVDATARIKATNWLSADAVIGYVSGKFTDVHDNMPMMPPLFYRLRCVAGSDAITAELSLQGAVTQTAISSSVRPEDSTPAWHIVNAAMSWQALDTTQIGISVLNVFDALYHEHQSINNLLAPGRSVRFVVGTKL